MTTDAGVAQVSVNQVPASVLKASDAVKMKRGPPTPAKRTSLEANASGGAAGAFRVALPVHSPTIPGNNQLNRSFTSPPIQHIQVELKSIVDLVAPPVISGQVSVTSQAPPQVPDRLYINQVRPHSLVSIRTSSTFNSNSMWFHPSVVTGRQNPTQSATNPHP